MRTTWVLGAGFSRPLGGPLLGDLLAFREQKLAKAILPIPLQEGMDLVTGDVGARAFCAYGMAHGYWGNAEEFLDAVETAAEDGAQAQSHHGLMLGALLQNTVRFPLQRVVSSKFQSGGGPRPGPQHKFADIGSLVDASRRAVVADCWSFLRKADLLLERWAPFVKWSRGLSEDDTVITFNYDAVPELLAAHESDGERGKLVVVRPHHAEEDMRTARVRRKAPVLKLHGSTTWFVTRDRTIGISDQGPPSPLLTKESIPLLGFPGPGKLANSKGELAPLWSLAEMALAKSEMVVFLGYRFPPTDAHARETLLDAIAEGGSSKKVKIVLGQDLARPEVSRMKGLLTYCVPPDHCEAAPLFVEDFLSRHVSQYLRPVVLTG